MAVPYVKMESCLPYLIQVNSKKLNLVVEIKPENAWVLIKHLHVSFAKAVLV